MVAFEVGPGLSPEITIRALAAESGARWSTDPVARVLEGQPELRHLLERGAGTLAVTLEPSHRVGHRYATKGR
jgi:hypothetical protein